MRFIRQFGIILALSFVGEILHGLIPLPVPASIYGIVLLFLGLETRLIPLAAVKETGSFLVGGMQLMFIPAAVGLMDAWGVIAPAWVQYAVLTVVTTFLVMGVSGWSAQAVLRRQHSKEEQAHE